MNTPSTSQVRAWAREQGVAVGDRGRLPADLVAQYLTAHGAPTRSAPTSTAPPRRRASAAPPASGEVVIGRTIAAKQRWDWNR